MTKEMKSRIIESLCVFVFFAIFITILNLSLNSLNYDIIWCFHLSQKVSDGYLMYSEISTVVTPIYFWFGGLFIKIFGNAITSMCIYAGVVQGIIATTIYNITKEVTKKENVLAIPLCLFFLLSYTSALCLSNYNSTAMMWVLIAVLVEIIREKNGNSKLNYLIGIILGLAFFTKQNIGAFAVIATGGISIINNIWFKKQNPMKEIFQKAVGFLSVVLVMLAYFFVTGTFLNFIDFCIGGLLEFGDKNLSFGIPKVYLGLIFILTLSFCFAFEKEKDSYFLIMSTYLIGMSTIIYPLTNAYHSTLGMLMTFPIMIRITDKFLDKELLYNIFIALIAYWSKLSTVSFSNIELNGLEGFFDISNDMQNFYIAVLYLVVYIIVAITFINKKQNWLKNTIMISLIIALGIHSYFYMNNLKDERIPKGLEIYANHGYTEKQMKYIENVIQYILEKEKEGYNVCVASADASYYMAALGRNNYKYDLTLYGSLGYNGEKRLIEETSNLKNTIILKDRDIMSQEPVKFDEFIKENYEVIDEIENLIVYGVKND